MAVGYRSGSGGTATGGGTTLAIPVPAGVAAGDLLVAIVMQDSDGVIASLTAGTSGFTQLGTDGAEVGISPAARCWYKVATGAETGSFTFGVDVNSTGAGAMACLTGANTTTPLDVTTSWSSGTGATETAPSLTVAAGSMLITGYLDQGGTGHAHSQPGGMTEVSDQATTWGAMAMDVEAQGGSGATGTRAATLTGTLGGNWRTVSLSVAAAPTTPYDHASSPPVVRSANYAAIATVSTATFYPPPGSLLVALLSFQWGNVTASATLLANDSSGGGNWTSAVHAESAGSRYAQSAIFTKYFAAAPGGITVTAGKTGTVICNISLAVRVVMNAAIDQTGRGTSSAYLTTTNAAQQSITAAQLGSRIYTVASLDNNDTLTVNGATTTIDLWQNASINAVNAIGRSTALTTAAGSQGPYGWSGGTTSSDTAVVSLEVLAAAGLIKTGGGIATGVGISPRFLVRLIKTGGAVYTSVGSGPKAMVLAPGIVAVNTLAGVEALGQLGFTVSTTAVGNAIMVGIRTNSTTLTVSSISGGGCTWTLAGRFTSTLRGRSYEIWIGQITAVVTNATATVTWSGDATVKTQSYNPQEFGNGVQSTWTRDGAQTVGVETSTTSATLAWPSLTAAGAGELYFAKGSVNTGIPTATGTPAGFTFKASTDCWAFGIPGSGAISPTSTTSTAATFGGVGALIIATPSAVNIVKTGGAVGQQIGSGSHAGTRATKTGGGLAVAAGVGARQGTRTKTGGAACSTAGIGARAGTRTKTGGAARPHLGVGTKVISSGPKTGGATAPWTATGSKAGFKGPRTGGAAVRVTGAGPARITSDWYYAATASPLSVSWAAPELATGPPTGDFATWTGPGTTPGVAGTLELAGFPARPPQVPSTAIPDSVTIKVRHSESPLDQVASVSARAYVGAIPVGASQPLTPADFPHEDEITITGLSSYADLVDLRVRIIVTRV